MRSLLSNKTVSGILLVAGLTIGAGMLALPITTGLDGFRNAALLLIVVYILMLYSLFVSLEVNLYLDNPNANIISNAKEFIGPIGQLLAWPCCLLLLFSLCAAYISGGGSLIARALTVLGWPYPIEALGAMIFIIVFSTVVFLGTYAIDLINKIFMLLLISSFICLIFFITPHVTVENLIYNGTQKYYLLLTLPIVMIAFAIQMILPSIRQHLNGNIPQLKTVLIWGTIIPLICYLIWDFLILGIIPVTGELSLTTLAESEHPIERMTIILQENFNLPFIALAVGVFSLCALITSYLSVMLSLIDFIADGLKINKSFKGRLILISLSVVPPVIFALYFPHAFLTALSFAGIFIAVLYGILPAWMAWRVRYILKLPIPYQAPFGKLGLIGLLLGAILLIVLDLGLTLEFISI